MDKFTIVVTAILVIENIVLAWCAAWSRIDKKRKEKSDTHYALLGLKNSTEYMQNQIGEINKKLFSLSGRIGEVENREQQRLREEAYIAQREHEQVNPAA